MKCLACRSKLRCSHQPKHSRLFYCSSCDRVFRFDQKAEALVPFGVYSSSERVPEDIPPIPVGDMVYVDNREHELFLEQGVVVKRDHAHYRVRFTSLDKSIDGRKLWVPQHWVRPFDLYSRRPD